MGGLHPGSAAGKVVEHPKAVGVLTGEANQGEVAARPQDAPGLGQHSDLIAHMVQHRDHRHGAESCVAYGQVYGISLYGEKALCDCSGEHVWRAVDDNRLPSACFEGECVVAGAAPNVGQPSAGRAEEGSAEWIEHRRTRRSRGVVVLGLAGVIGQQSHRADLVTSEVEADGNATRDRQRRDASSL